MKKISLLIMLGSCLMVQAQDPEVKIEVLITDEAGQAISNAAVNVWFSKLKTNNPFDGQDDFASKGISDEKGVFIASSTTLGTCGVKVEKNGYYLGRAKLNLNKQKDGKWIPWHQIIELKMRKMESPIPMYARRIERLVIPIADAPVGYDLKTGDWVSPYGKGVKSDLTFALQRELRSRFDFNWQLSVKFSGESNGFQGIPPSDEFPQSELRFPKTAPADSYVISNLFMAVKSTMDNEWKTNSVSATNFFFRVRSKYDENQQLTSALYGKLLGPIIVNIQGTKTAKLYFTYYLNPTPLDRNMEFDLEKNLFKNLNMEEQPRKP